MGNRKIVIALGGNAILSDEASATAQQRAIEETVEHLVKLIEKGDKLIISHGNGPQVGNLLLQQQATDSQTNPAMPLDTCVAMTQGSIGYWMENAMIRALERRGIHKNVATIVTQVIVDEKDPAFDNPTKPIGPFLTAEQAEIEMKKNNSKFVEDAGRGWRKVVASPKPIGIQEHEVVNTLIENDVITISAGGGGIPVVGKERRGVEAVIDKDFASEKLAELVDADLFVILTGVENVSINYGKENEKKLDTVTVTQLEEYMEQGHFAPGSMLPKVQAAVSYVKASPQNKAIITSLENVGKLVNGETGTIITNNG